MCHGHDQSLLLHPAPPIFPMLGLYFDKKVRSFFGNFSLYLVLKERKMHGYNNLHVEKLEDWTFYIINYFIKRYSYAMLLFLLFITINFRCNLASRFTQQKIRKRKPYGARRTMSRILFSKTKRFDRSSVFFKLKLFSEKSCLVYIYICTYVYIASPRYSQM